ncbi:MAG: amino acid ABC transporter permease [Actinomycetota bacterium]
MIGVTFDWHTFFNYLLPPDQLTRSALYLTLGISIVAQFFGVVFGLISALMQRSKFRVLRFLSGMYVWFFRGTPVIVQIFFIYFGANLFLNYDLFPRTAHFLFISIDGAVLAGAVALSINEGAYMSEIVRAGIAAVDGGQLEAAKTVGLTHSQAMRRIVLPQAGRVIMPPLGNEFNNMLKTTSLLAFISVRELFQDAEIRYSSSFKPVEYFSGVAVLYLLLTTLWGFVQKAIERKFAESDRDISAKNNRFTSRMFGTKRYSLADHSNMAIGGHE